MRGLALTAVMLALIFEGERGRSGETAMMAVRMMADARSTFLQSGRMEVEQAVWKTSLQIRGHQVDLGESE